MLLCLRNQNTFLPHHILFRVLNHIQYTNLSLAFQLMPKSHIVDHLQIPQDDFFPMTKGDRQTIDRDQV